MAAVAYTPTNLYIVHIMQHGFGTAPPDDNFVAPGTETVGVSPEADSAVRRGGLY